jgi:hypothetical protein
VIGAVAQSHGAARWPPVRQAATRCSLAWAWPRKPTRGSAAARAFAVRSSSSPPGGCSRKGHAGTQRSPVGRAASSRRRPHDATTAA